jgi:hypothetical protein
MITKTNYKDDIKPGNIIYKVYEWLPGNWDCKEIEILEVTLDIQGIKSFYYRHAKSNQLFHYEFDSKYYDEIYFFCEEDAAKKFIEEKEEEYALHRNKIKSN